jgi:transposase-like protein
MITLDVFGSKSVAADLLEQVRWRDGVTCPRCRSDRTVRNGSYRELQRYLCKNCDRTFNDKTGKIFAHSKIALQRWLSSIYALHQFNTSLRQLQYEIEVTHKTMHRRIERFARALDAPSLDLVGPVEIDEGYALPGRKAASATPGRARVACHARAWFVQWRQATRVHYR